MTQLSETTDPATGPAFRPLATIAVTGEVDRAAVQGVVRAWRRTAHRGPANRRPSQRQIRSLLQLAAGGAA